MPEEGRRIECIASAKPLFEKSLYLMCGVTRPLMRLGQACRGEIVSKVILRHANLSAPQRYLGKFTDKAESRKSESGKGSCSCNPSLI
jgi:hypothetical protein